MGILRNCARYGKHVIAFDICGKVRKCVGVHFSNNLKQIRKMKNSAERKRCFIVATGPSLTCTDLELLSEEDTFGVNSIFLLYNRTNWRPSYYVCTDAGYFEKVFNEYNLKGTKLAEKESIFNANSQNIVEIDGSVNFVKFSNWNRSTNFAQTRFSDDLVYGLYAFGTVTNIAMAIAMYMGYKEIYLIGADCSNLNKHFVNDITDEGKTDEKAEELAQLQLTGYCKMKEIAEKNGIKIVNATRGGALEVFEREQLEKVLGRSSK